VLFLYVCFTVFSDKELVNQANVGVDMLTMGVVAVV
jgi:hypothetical protein